MTDTTWLFIVCCWIAWVLYWLIMAFPTKRTVERGGLIGYRVVTVVLVIGLIAAGRLLHVSSHSHLWRTTLALGALTDCVVAAGAAFTVWARITLGRNWSAEVTFKQDHELIESGPYALARHPIYTGLIAMALGITPQAVSKRVASGGLLALRRGRVNRLPAWQFYEDTVLPGLKQLISTYPGGALSLTIWATSPSPDLDGTTPAQVLARRGGPSRVLEAARALTPAAW